MVTDFQDRLRQIREEKDRESQQKRALTTAADQERFTRLEALFDRRDQIDHVIEEYGQKFMAEVPSFERNRSFFEGKYMVEFHQDDLRIDESGQVVKLFSRIAFLIETHSDDGSFVVACRKTVRNRDLDSSTARIEASEEALAAFHRFTEEQFVEFASEYFSSSRTTSAGK